MPETRDFPHLIHKATYFSLVSLMSLGRESQAGSWGGAGLAGGDRPGGGGGGPGRGGGVRGVSASHTQ